ncbi:MAG: electron transport complex subunit RsxC [Candidatus Omnitrophota bacterium]
MKKFMTFTFKGGIHPSYKKEISLKESFKQVVLPDKIEVPISQHIGKPADPIVKKGDLVEEGSIIADSNAFISSCIHSSVSGKVLDIKKAFHPSLGPTLSIFIERDKSKAPKEYPKIEEQCCSAQEIIQKVRDAGIVGMGGAAFPTHVKLSVPEGKKIDTLIINGAECEPYLTCDHVMMLNKTQEILEGIGLIFRVLQPKKTYIAIENNKQNVLDAFHCGLKTAESLKGAEVEIIALETKYPQGGEKQLISAISGKEVPPGKLPLDIGFLVQNIGTIYAIYEAVYFNKPLLQRMVTISGDCVENPGNYIVKIGTTVTDLIELCGIKFKKNPKKVIIGGPMMGFSQPGTDAAVLKNTSGILFLSEETAPDFEEGQCIRCAKCVDVCPVRLSPTDIMRSAKKNLWDKTEEAYVTDCMECGSCTYVCPARIPLVQYIKEAKRIIAKKK